MPFQMKSPSQSPISKEGSTPQSYNPWWLPEDHSRTPTPWLSRCWLFHSNSIHLREYWPRILQGQFQEFVNHSNQLSRYQALQHSLDNSIDP
ncbi:hypothetical protein O181_074448 [Austropuccinia psidii MF-1]|uniref:Uncharacterized protein n=1 Tax=Austropuccinia psidii MF-1 TaxID=1389203 RepID=A0A9Q3FB20_9BASI|nr:hypothetical protein [Austropuccinia psidii MF-1]